MTDTNPTPGNRLDAKLAQIRTAFDDLLAELNAAKTELGDKVEAKIDALSASIDEVQAAWETRGDDDTVEPSA